MKGRFHRDWLVFALPILIFIPGVNAFFYLAGSEYSDLLISHYPNLVYLRRSLLEYGVVPLWSPSILGGAPFYSNPLSGMWYPPGWLPIWFPEPWAFNLTAAFHLVCGAAGAARLLGELGLGREARWIGAAAFGMLPKLAAHYGAGHITLVYAVAWTPWLLLAAARPQGSRLGQAGWLAVIFFADPRWAAYAGVLWLAFSVSRARPTMQGVFRIAETLGRPLAETANAALLAAPLLVPLLAAARLTTRANLLPDEVLALSFPPVGLLGLWFPAGGAEWQIYPGAAVLILAVIALLRPQVRRRSRFWWLAAAAALLFALGESIPILGLWAYLPGANLLRVPARALFVFGLCAGLLAAYAVDDMVRHRQEGRPPKIENLWLAAAAGLWFSIWVFHGTLGVPSWVLPVAAASLAAVVVFRALGTPRWAALLTAVIAADLGLAAMTQLEPRAAAFVFSEGEQAAAWIASRPGRFRVYSPSYSIPQHTAARLGLELADGVDPLQFQPYVAYMAAAAGFEQHGYSVTLPPFDGPVKSANADLVPDAALLGRLNVRYIAAEFEIESEGLVAAAQFGETRIYENTLALGEGWRKEDGQGSVVVRWFPNRIEIVSVGPVSVILAEIHTPGWSILGGLREAPADGLLRTVRIPEGSVSAAMEYRPVDLSWGLGLGGLGLAIAWVRRGGRDE